MNKRKIGEYGENLAKKWLEKEGYILIASNVYTPYGEIDLIVKKDKKIYFVEVKYRRGNKYGGIKESLTYKKLSHLKKSVSYYLRNNEGYIDFRIAFVGIVDNNGEFYYEWIENVFD